MSPKRAARKARALLRGRRNYDHGVTNLDRVFGIETRMMLVLSGVGQVEFDDDERRRRRAREKRRRAARRAGRH